MDTPVRRHESSEAAAVVAGTEHVQAGFVSRSLPVNL